MNQQFSPKMQLMTVPLVPSSSVLLAWICLCVVCKQGSQVVPEVLRLERIKDTNALDTEFLLAVVRNNKFLAQIAAQR